MLTRTTTALLDDLAQPGNEEIWNEFDARFRPVLVGFGRRLGLGDEDAADMAQEALAKFVKAYRGGQYDRGRGRLSSWLIGIARNCMIDQQKKNVARREARGVSGLVGLPGDDELTSLWDAECERAILARAVAALHTETDTDPRTVLAFELLAFQQLTPAQVAGDLDMTMNDVYLAKHRCLKRLRSIVADVTRAFEADA
jgi:RNA polymerase sigma factor (sigma-70 family)